MKREKGKHTGRDYHDDHEQRQPQTLHDLSHTRRPSYEGAGRDGPREDVLSQLT